MRCNAVRAVQFTPSADADASSVAQLRINWNECERYCSELAGLCVVGLLGGIIAPRGPTEGWGCAPYYPAK